MLLMQGEMPSRVSRRKLRNLLSEGINLEVSFSYSTPKVTREDITLLAE